MGHRYSSVALLQYYVLCTLVVTCASFLRLVGVVPGGVATISPSSYPCSIPSIQTSFNPYSLLISRIPTAQVHHVEFLTFKDSDRDSIVFNVVAIAAVSISLSPEIGIPTQSKLTANIPTTAFSVWNNQHTPFYKRIALHSATPITLHPPNRTRETVPFV